MVVRLIGLAKEVDERADEVKTCPAYVEPVEACWQVAHEEMQNQVRAGAHQQAREGDELEAVEGRGPV